MPAPPPVPHTGPPPGTALVSFDEMDRISKVVSSSGLYKLTAAQTFTLMLLAQSKGMHPIQAMERYHVIQGRPSMRADAMLAEFQAKGGTVEWTVSTDTEVEGIFRHAVQAPKGNVSRFSLQDAHRAGLPAVNPNWIKYPNNMLRSRVIANGVRMTLPGIITGIYTPDEINEFEPAPPPRQAEVRVVERPAAARGANGRGQLTSSPIVQATTPGHYTSPIDASPAEVPPETPTQDPIIPRVSAAKAILLRDLMQAAQMTEYQINVALTKRGVDRVEDLDEIAATTMINKLEAAVSVEKWDPLASKDATKPADEPGLSPVRAREPGDDDEPFDDVTGKVLSETADVAPDDDAHEQREIDAEFDRPLSSTDKPIAGRKGKAASTAR